LPWPESPSRMRRGSAIRNGTARTGPSCRLPRRAPSSVSEEAGAAFFEYRQQGVDVGDRRRALLARLLREPDDPGVVAWKLHPPVLQREGVVADCPGPSAGARRHRRRTPPPRRPLEQVRVRNVVPRCGAQKVAAIGPAAATTMSQLPAQSAFAPSPSLGKPPTVFILNPRLLALALPLGCRCFRVGRFRSHCRPRFALRAARLRAFRAAVEVCEAPGGAGPPALPSASRLMSRR
jgi:hypothetical protein